MTERCDIAVIGAGAVGCAIVRHLKIKYPNRDIVMIEKNGEVASETSQLNSGVVHSGIHENPTFLKSSFARTGSIAAVQFAESHQVPIIKCGMLAVAGGSSLIGGLMREWKSFFRLMRKARGKNIDFRFVLGMRQITALEPNLRALAAIHIPGVCVVDPKVFVEELASDALASGVRFFFNSEIKSICRQGDCWELSSSGETFLAGTVINSAGLYADDIAAMSGTGNYKIYPWRGEYYEVIGEKAKFVKRLIYVVTPPKNSGKGIHFSPRPDGRLFIGPNAKPVPTKNYYWQDKSPVEDFLEVGQQFCPGLEKEDLRWAYSGIRPRLAADSHEADFLIRMDCQDPPFVNLIGIESPGLTASMAIGEYVGKILKDLI